MKEKLIVFEDSMTDKDIIKSLIPFFNDIYALNIIFYINAIINIWN